MFSEFHGNQSANGKAMFPKVKDIETNNNSLRLYKFARTHENIPFGLTTDSRGHFT
jgi:hypothetical protein